MIKKCILILSLFLLSFCTKKEADYKINKEIQTLVDGLSKEKTVLYDETNKIPKFQNLLKVASNKDLLYLTESKIPLIRCYAFRGLTSRNYSGLKKLFYKHLKDSVLVETHLSNTCIIMNISVHQYMLDQLHPFSSKCKYKLSRSEFDKYFELSYNKK